MSWDRFRRNHRRTAVVVVAGLAIVACGGDDSDDGAGDSPAPTTAGATDAGDTDAGDTDDGDGDDVQRFPDVIGATATFDGETWTIAATLSSPYDTPERYADSWRVVGPDGTVYGERFLFHDHQDEQPFTRSQSGIVIPADVDVVTIEGRDQQYGWGGATYDLALER